MYTVSTYLIYGGFTIDNVFKAKKYRRIRTIGISVLLTAIILTGCTNNTANNENPSQTEENTVSASAEIEPWRQFLKDYEAWVDSWIEISKKYRENPKDLTIISDYTNMLSEMYEWGERADEYENELKNDDMSSEEFAEYMNTLSRILIKISKAYEE